MGRQPTRNPDEADDVEEGLEDVRHSRLRIVVIAILILVAVSAAGWVATHPSDSKSGGASATKISLWGLEISTNSVAVGIGALGLVGALLVLKVGQNADTGRRTVSKRGSIDIKPPDKSLLIQTNSADTSKPSVQKLGYKILNRSITCEFLTQTMCRTSHEIVVLATTKEGLQQYHGRHPLFDKNEKMVVKPPHRLLPLGVVSDNWQNFVIQLEPPLAEGKNTVISMNFKWTSKAYEEHPDAFMVPFCETDSLSFLISFAPGLKVENPVGQMFAHPGSHKATDTKLLELKNNTVYWGQLFEPTILTQYRLSWKWGKTGVQRE